MVNREKLDKVMTELGHPTHQLGYDYLYVAVTIYKPHMAITKELYPRVAKARASTASRVERAIRHNIETAWARASLDDQLHYFGNTIDPHRGKPTNAEYIDRLWRICNEN